MRKTAALCSVLIVLHCAPLSRGAEGVRVETVLAGLDDPRGVAVRPGGTPESYEIFVAEGGQRRVVSLASDRPNHSTEVITEFPTLSTPERGANPVCLLFLDRERLVAGLDGTPPSVRLYELSGAHATLTADQSTHEATAEIPEAAQTNPGRCLALARTRTNDHVADMLLLAVGGYDPMSALWKIPVRAGTLREMTALENTDGVHEPQAIAVSEQGYVVVADRARSSVEMRLIFLNPANGRSVMLLETNLRHVFGLAYSPKTRNLYALGKESAASDEAALYRIDDASQAASGNARATTAVKVADLHRPEALAFGPDGALYVTATVEQTDGESNHGALLKLTGEL